jgi:hypothetical protein
VAETEQKPDGEQQEELLLGAGAQGLGSGLRSLNQLIEGLQR